MLQKLELEKQTTALNHLIASIHAEQRLCNTSVAIAGDGYPPVGDGGGSLSPIKRVPSDGDDAKSPLNSLDEDCDNSEDEELKNGDGNCSSGDDSDDGCRTRNRLLSVVAEVDGEDESIYEQKVRSRALNSKCLAHWLFRSYCRCCTRERAWQSVCNRRQQNSSN